MKKLVVAIALLILILGVISLLISETRLEEEIIDEWNPLTPPTLFPDWHGINESDHTGCFFIERARGNNEIFRTLFDQGKISELLLELNVSASNRVNVKVGKFLFFNETTGETFFSIVFFNRTGVFINEIVEVMVNKSDAKFYYLEIRNEGSDSVNISGYVILKGKMPKVFYPFYRFGTVMCFLGFCLAIYGFLAKPKRKRTSTR